MKKLLLATLLGASAAATAADDLALRIEHDSTVIGADGVTRNVRFAERLIRRDAQSWLARVLPPGAHEEAEHTTGAKGHKHMDTAAATRWVTRAPDGKLKVRLVNDHDRMIVDIAPVDYANIGFDGRWSTAAQLIDPEQIRQMKPFARSAPAGTRWYESGTPDARVQVLWDEKDKYPRRIESSNAAGTRRSVLNATREALPAVLPWTRLDGYALKEYSDLLD